MTETKNLNFWQRLTLLQKIAVCVVAVPVGFAIRLAVDLVFGGPSGL